MEIFGRALELKQIRKAIERSERITDRISVIGLLGEPGAGKTTLLDPAYRHLANRREAVGLTNQLHPVDSSQNAFIWWALRLSPPLRGRTKLSYCAVATQKSALTAELERIGTFRSAFGRKRRMRSIFGSSILALIFDYILGLLPGGGAIKTVGDGIFKLVENRKLEGQLQNIDSEAVDFSLLEPLVNSVVSDIKKASSSSGLNIPVYITVDDAQFIDADPITRELLSQLIEAGTKEKLNLTILFTQWADSWKRKEGMAGLIGDGAGLHVVTVDVGKLPEAYKLIEERFPALLVGETKALAERLGHNPRAVSELCAYLERHRRFFKERDHSRGLIDQWEMELPNDISDIAMLIRDRVDALEETDRKMLLGGALLGQYFDVAQVTFAVGIEWEEGWERIRRLDQTETFLASLGGNAAEISTPFHLQVLQDSASDFLNLERSRQALLLAAFDLIWQSCELSRFDAGDALPIDNDDPEYGIKMMSRTNKTEPQYIDQIPVIERLRIIDTVLDRLQPEDEALFDIEVVEAWGILQSMRAQCLLILGDWNGASAAAIEFGNRYNEDRRIGRYVGRTAGEYLMKIRSLPGVHAAIDPFLIDRGEREKAIAVIYEARMQSALTEYEALLDGYGDDLTPVQRAELEKFVAEMRDIHNSKVVHVELELMEKAAHVSAAILHALEDEQPDWAKVEREADTAIEPFAEELEAYRQSKQNQTIPLDLTENLMIVNLAIRWRRGESVEEQIYATIRSELPKNPQAILYAAILMTGRPESKGLFLATLERAAAPRVEGLDDPVSVISEFALILQALAMMLIRGAFILDGAEAGIIASQWETLRARAGDTEHALLDKGSAIVAGILAAEDAAAADQADTLQN